MHHTVEFFWERMSPQTCIALNENHTQHSCHSWCCCCCCYYHHYYHWLLILVQNSWHPIYQPAMLPHTRAPETVNLLQCHLLELALCNTDLQWESNPSVAMTSWGLGAIANLVVQRHAVLLCSLSCLTLTPDYVVASRSFLQLYSNSLHAHIAAAVILPVATTTQKCIDMTSMYQEVVICSVMWFFEFLKNPWFQFFKCSRIREPPDPLLWKKFRIKEPLVLVI